MGSSFGEEKKKNDLHRGNSVKLTDGYRQDYRQRNTFLSTFRPVPGTMQSVSCPSLQNLET
jgi:hypothetical protein